MPVLYHYSLPLPKKLPSELEYDERSLSQLSTSTAFKTGIDQRDLWDGQQRCVICGVNVIKHCHIIPCSESQTWKDLRRRKYIPSTAKSVQHEPRNGLLMCPNHCAMFDRYQFFIRFIPQHKKFVYINYSGQVNNAIYHGKAINLDISHHHAPFPSIFLIHEQRVRGFWPFVCEPNDILPMPESQGWLKADEVVSDPEREGGMSNSSMNLACKNMGSALGGEERPGMTSLDLDANAIQEILLATYRSPSWKACMQEGTSWEGTAEENVAKYNGLVEL
ncbi:hypothetical protein BU17DRAFT_53478 [Hysterangium stoloniferum]|nr:hypothetical protein BU17DRAFT_53478 [Hysterangium stoloniferum]